MGEGGLRNRAGDVGDLAGGGSFGPFQLYTKGALPAQYRGRPRQADAWAWSPAGIDYAIRQMSQAGARGKKGHSAVDTIVRKFERPADPDTSVRKAIGRYGGIQIGPPPPAGGGGGGGGSGPFAVAEAARRQVRQARKAGIPATAGLDPVLASMFNSTNKMFGLPEISFAGTPGVPGRPGLKPRQRAKQTTRATWKGDTKATAPLAKDGMGSYPLAKRGKVIGTPFAGTHSLGDWQSDNAVDIAAPIGTPIRAAADGRIGSKIGSLGKGGQFAGQRLYVESKGNSFYYAHLSRITVKPGQRVRKGQIIGYSGSANGVGHLHIGVQKGDPRRILF